MVVGTHQDQRAVRAAGALEQAAAEIEQCAITQSAVERRIPA